MLTSGPTDYEESISTLRFATRAKRSVFAACCCKLRWASCCTPLGFNMISLGDRFNLSQDAMLSCDTIGLYLN